MVVCTYVYMHLCVLYRPGKEEWPWPISGAKINNQSIIINQRCVFPAHIPVDACVPYRDICFPN